MNGGGICAICGARQGAYDSKIGLPRCRGELAHPMYFHVPVAQTPPRRGAPNPSEGAGLSLMQRET